MVFHETALRDVYIIDLNIFSDDRGIFARTFCKREFAQIGHTEEFVQFNHSRTLQRGTLRGLHFQRPPHAEIKLIRCIRGSVFDVVVDLRQGSPTFLQHIGVDLSEQNMRMIYIPKGCAHGFQTLEADSELIYHHTHFYNPAAEGGIRYDDPQIAIEWPLTPTLMSDKDQHYPFLQGSFEGIRSFDE